MNYRTGHFVLPEGIRLSNKKHALGGRYFLFELPIEKRVRIDALDLISHHVSVYESPIGKIDLKSQYHYTAFFENAAGKEYRLHVYFDAKDGMVTSPMLSVLRGDKYEPVDSDDLDEVFTGLATTACSELVIFLRRAQRNRVDNLQRQFQELENRLEALSSNLVKNKKEYLEVMTGQIQVLDELSKISNKSPAIIKQMKWLIASKELIEPETFQPEPVSDSENDDTRAEPLEAKATRNENTAASVKSKKNQKAKAQTAPQKVKVKPSISGEVENLKLKNAVAVRLDGTNQANELSELYRTLKEKEWQVEFKERSATVEDLNDLRVLRASIEKSAGELLQRFLLQSDFKNTELLNQFYHLLPDNMLLFALQSCRHQLLDFLLKNNIATVNFKNFTIKNVVYPTMVDYFFTSSAPDAARLSCLDVLVKQGASLLAIDSKSGLPYAALLLSQPNHPLRAVLEQNKKLTLDSIDFHSKMNQVLRSLNTSSPVIDELIESNKTTIFLLRQKIKPFQRQDEKQELSLGQDLVRQIRMDPEVSYQTSLIRKKVASLLPNAPAANKKQMISLTEMNFELLAIRLNGIDDLDLIPPFEDVKRETIKLQYLTLEYIALADETFSYLGAFTSINPYARKESKAIRKIRLRLNEIDARILDIKDILMNSYRDLLQEQARNAQHGGVQLLTKMLSDEVSTDSDSSETENEDEGSALRKGFSNTFFAPQINTVDTVSPTVNDTEEPSNEVNDASSRN